MILMNRWSTGHLFPLYEGNTESLEDDGEGQEFWRIIDGRKYYFHKVHDIPLRNLLSVNYNSLLLECKTDAVSTNEIAVVQKQEYVSSDERRIRIQQINEQMAEMHKVKMQLEEELKEMNQWVEAKTRVIKAYETYLGSYNDNTLYKYKVTKYDEIEYRIKRLNGEWKENSQRIEKTRPEVIYTDDISDFDVNVNKVD